MTAANSASSANSADLQNEKITTEPTAKAVMSLIRQEDRVLAVRVNGMWTLPGAIQRPGESEEDAQARGLLECTGLRTGEAVKVYAGPNSIVFVACSTDRHPAPVRLERAWLTELELLANTQRPALFRKVFEEVERAHILQSTVISKLKDGRILYAIQYERWCRDHWEVREAHHVHAIDAADARQQFNGLLEPGDLARIIGIAPAIGFFQQADGSLIG